MATCNACASNLQRLSFLADCRDCRFRLVSGSGVLFFAAMQRWPLNLFPARAFCIWRIRLRHLASILISLPSLVRDCQTDSRRLHHTYRWETPHEGPIHLLRRTALKRFPYAHVESSAIFSPSVISP